MQVSLPTFCRPLSLTLPRKSSPTHLVYVSHTNLPSSKQIEAFIEGLFTLNHAIDRFKLNLRDFLIQLKEFAGDNAELFAEDREQEADAARAAERERLAKVGGLLKPSELEEDEL